MALVDRLEQDHDEAEAHHATIDALVRRWLADGSLAAPYATQLHERLAHLRTLYERHIAVEDRELLPTAARVLDAGEIRQIGREMALRRQLQSDIVSLGTLRGRSR